MSGKPFEGLTLAVTAPSRQWVKADGGMDWELRRRAFAAAESLGFSVKEMLGTALETARFAGEDAVRCADFMSVMTEVNAHIVMALRGGYGAGRLLSLIDWDKLKSGTTPLIGYSDCTALNLALLAKTGRESWQGPTLRDLIDADPLTVEGLKQVAGLSPFSVSWQTKDAPADLEMQGLLWGGNLAVLTSLLGSDYFPKVEGGILFVEDVGEPAYRVERMLLSLENAGILRQQRALLIGDLAGADRPVGWEGDFSCAHMLAFIRERTGLPVVTGLPFGHIHAKCSLPVGRRVSLRVAGNDARLGDADN